MERIQEKELTFLSNYSWDNPNVLELLCETAAYNEKNIRYFSKPSSLFKAGPIQNYKSSISSIESNPLYNFSVKFSRVPILSRIQDLFIWKQIYSKKHKDTRKVLLYNNLDSLISLKNNFLNNFELLIYLCEDYSPLNKRLISNCEISDCILVIPNSMVDILKANFPNKKIIEWPQPVTSFSDNDVSLNDKKIVDELLAKIPKPRIVYSGHGLDRLDKDIYLKISQKFNNCSFISFGSPCNLNGNNIYQLPSLSRRQIKYLLSKSQIGFMPYDISDYHNEHCVPLKLFEYFSEGLPVVSSFLLNVVQYDHVFYMSKSLDEFKHNINKALSEPQDSILRKNRIDIFKNHSTISRSKEFNLEISNILDSKFSSI